MYKTHTHTDMGTYFQTYIVFMATRKLVSFPKFVQSLMLYLLGTPHMVPFSGTGRRILKTRWADVFFFQMEICFFWFDYLIAVFLATFYVK